MPSDTSREQKLAAARKKLREYQSKKAQGEDQRKSSDTEQKSEVSSNEDKNSGACSPEESALNPDAVEFVPVVTSKQKEVFEVNQDGMSSTINDQDYDTSPDSSSMVTVVPVLDSSPTVKSTTESLRQLSLQITGLMTDSGDQGQDQPNIVVTELERRNEELAGLLNLEIQKSGQFHKSNEELKQQLSLKDQEIILLKQNGAASPQLQIDLDAAGRELEAHVGTIKMLTSDNARLQSALNETQKTIMANMEEMMALKNSLEASQENCKYLESCVDQKQKELATVETSSISTSQELNILSQKVQLLQFQNDEFETTVDELKEKLSSKTTENELLTKEIASYKSKLELANIHVQQLRDSSTEELTEQLSKLQTSLGEAQNQITFLNSTIEKTQHDKITLEHQYKSYTNQLSVELDQYKQKMHQNELVLEELRNKNEMLQKQAKENESHGTMLPPDQNPQIVDLQTELINLTGECAKWKESSERLQRNNDELSKLVSEQQETMERLESAEDRKNSQQVDTEQLLQSMQSDKVAAARALSQNKQLKEQLEELQNGFIMMSNKKLELTEKLELELHAKKALNKKISELNHKLSSKKDISSSTEPKENINEVQHIEATDHLKVESPSTENGEAPPTQKEEALPFLEAQTTGEKEQSESTSKVEDSSTAESTAVVESASMERSDVAQNENAVIEQPIPEKVLERPLISKEFHAAHEALQARFTKCMTDLAAKIDENQRLEHLVTRLQLETEAVGDYITIYQYRRGVMKKKMQEVREQLENLQAEKQQMSAKLVKLQNLATKLPSSKDTSTKHLISELNSVVQDVEGKSEKDAPQTETQNGVMSNGTTDDSGDQTVEKIRDLIKEMETANQADHSGLKKFHPCHSCSGKLIHV